MAPEVKIEYPVITTKYIIAKLSFIMNLIIVPNRITDIHTLKLLMQKFEEYVTKIDETPLTGSQKMWTLRKC